MQKECRSYENRGKTRIEPNAAEKTAGLSDNKCAAWSAAA